MNQGFFFFFLSLFKLFQTSDDFNEHCTMEYFKTCKECLNCYYETNNEDCLHDDKDHQRMPQTFRAI